MFDCRTNRTPIERLGSIGFWFGFVRLATPGLLQKHVRRGDDAKNPAILSFSLLPKGPS